MGPPSSSFVCFPHVINCPPDLVSLGVSVVVKRAIKKQCNWKTKATAWPARPKERSAGNLGVILPVTHAEKLQPSVYRCVQAAGWGASKRGI